MKSVAGLNERDELTVYNEMPRNHPRRRAVETAIRKAFSGIRGQWSVVVQLSSSATLVVVVLAPDRSAWVINCANPMHWNPETLGGTVRAVCKRRGWIRAPARYGRKLAKEVGEPADGGAARRAVPNKKGQASRSRHVPRPR